jgi:chromosome segregation ATPase
MKWAIIGIIAVILLGAIGYAVYTLTDVPEQTQEWWDEKKLDNFETLANRELDDNEKKIADLEKTLDEKRAEEKLWEGDESFKENNFMTFKQTGFKTKLGYDALEKFYMAQGKALGAAYKKAAQGPDVVIDDSTGKMSEDMEITVDLPDWDGESWPAWDGKATFSKTITAGDIRKHTERLSTDLEVIKTERQGVEDVVKQYKSLISDMESQIAEMKDQLREMRQQVTIISAKIKVEKAKADLDELNASIRGESDKSELGNLIRGYNERKTKLQAEQLVRAEKTAEKDVSASDLTRKGSSGSSTKNQFLD